MGIATEVPVTGKVKRTVPKNKNAKVMWVTPGQQFNVAKCHDVPWPVAHAYRRQYKHDPKYRGGILVVLSMETIKYAESN